MNAPEHAQIQRAALDGGVWIPRTLFAPSATQPRTTFDKEYLEGMAETIKKQGVLHPILAREIAGAKPGQPLYEIVDGECRWRASEMAGVDIMPTIVKAYTDMEVMQIQLTTFLQRKGLNELEEARGYQNMLRKPNGVQGYASVDELAASVSKSRRYVYNRLKLLELPADAKAELTKGTLTASVALLVAGLQPADQPKGLKVALEGWGGRPLTQREAAEQFERLFMLRLDKAPFKTADAMLVPAAGSCRDCPKRTGKNPDLFPDIKSADTCTDSKCYQLKVDTHHENVKAAAKSDGMEVITGNQAKKVKPDKHGSLKGYMELDKVNYNIDGSKPLSKLLGKDAPPTVLLEDPHTHELVKVVREDAAIAALKAKGVIKQSRIPSSGADQRASEARAKAATAWRTAAAKACADAVAGPEVDHEALARFIWPEVAVWMVRNLGHDDGKRFARLVDWESMEKYEDRIRALTTAELGRVLVAATLAGDAHVNTYNTKPNDAPRILRFAAQLNVNVAQIRRDLAAGAKPSKTTSTPQNSAAAQGAKPGQKTPETALAEAVAKEAKPAPAPATKKKTSQKDNTAKLSASKATPTKPTALAKGSEVKDKAAAPPAEAPAAQLSSVAAWPFPKAVA